MRSGPARTLGEIGVGRQGLSRYDSMLVRSLIWEGAAPVPSPLPPGLQRCPCLSVGGLPLCGLYWTRSRLAPRRAEEFPPMAVCLGPLGGLPAGPSAARTRAPRPSQRRSPLPWPAKGKSGCQSQSVLESMGAPTDARPRENSDSTIGCPSPRHPDSPLATGLSGHTPSGRTPARCRTQEIRGTTVVAETPSRFPSV
jgi:hypothetical protein